MDEEDKGYNSHGDAVNSEPAFAEKDAVPDNSNEILRRRLLQKIEEKRRLINLTKAMSGAPASEGGINSEKASKTVQLLKKDISDLAKELIELESDPKNFETNNNPETLILEYLPIIGEAKDQVLEGIKKKPQEEANKKQEVKEQELLETNRPPHIEEKYKREKVDTPQIHDTYEPTSRIGTESTNKYVDSWRPKFFSVKGLIIIALWLLIIGIVVISLSYIISYIPAQTPPSAEKVANPASALTNTSNTTGMITQSKFKHTYIDSEGNLHEVTNYTTQGGSKYDVIINNTSISRNETTLTVNKFSKTNKTEPSKNRISSFITNLEKEIVGWWEENKSNAEFSSATHDIKIEPVTDADKIIGKWVMYDPSAAQNGYENSYTFNRDNTGEKITILDGKSFFKYQISGNNIVLLDIKPCNGFDIVPQDAYTNPCEKKVKRYEFRDNDTLILDNTVFERK